MTTTKTAPQKIEAHISKPRLRILRALAVAKGPLNTRTLSEKAQVAFTYVAEYTLRAGKATAGTKALCELGLVRQIDSKVEQNEDGSWSTEKAYEITASGCKLLARLDKEAGKAPKAKAPRKAKAAAEANGQA